LGNAILMGNGGSAQFIKGRKILEVADISSNTPMLFCGDYGYSWSGAVLSIFRLHYSKRTYTLLGTVTPIASKVILTAFATPDNSRVYLVIGTTSSTAPYYLAEINVSARTSITRVTSASNLVGILYANDTYIYYSDGTNMYKALVATFATVTSLSGGASDSELYDTNTRQLSPDGNTLLFCQVFRNNWTYTTFNLTTLVRTTMYRSPGDTNQRISGGVFIDNTYAYILGTYQGYGARTLYKCLLSTGATIATWYSISSLTNVCDSPISVSSLSFDSLFMLDAKNSEMYIKVTTSATPLEGVLLCIDITTMNIVDIITLGKAIGASSYSLGNPYVQSSFSNYGKPTSVLYVYDSQLMKTKVILRK